MLLKDFQRCFLKCCAQRCFNYFPQRFSSKISLNDFSGFRSKIFSNMLFKVFYQIELKSWKQNMSSCNLESNMSSSKQKTEGAHVWRARLKLLPKTRVHVWRGHCRSGNPPKQNYFWVAQLETVLRKLNIRSITSSWTIIFPVLTAHKVVRFLKGEPQAKSEHRREYNFCRRTTS